MKKLLLTFLALISIAAPAQSGPEELAQYLDHLRHMTPAERSTLFESSHFQKHAAEERRLDELVFRSLLTDDLGPYRATLIQGLGDSDAFIRRYTASLVNLAAMGPAAAVSPEGERAIVLRSLVRPLFSLASPPEDGPTRIAALTALGHMLYLKNPSVQVFLERATLDIDAKVRGTALVGVASSSQNPASALETELKFVTAETDADNRKIAAALLGDSPSEDSRILIALRSAIEDVSPRVQRAAVHALYRRSHADIAALDTLRTKLTQTNLNPGVRAQIESDLHDAGPAH